MFLTLVTSVRLNVFELMLRKMEIWKGNMV
jgi:hypothetical protein